MKLKILFAVLDWGLGHATRSETIIQQLVMRGARVTIASSGLALQYLKRRFDNLIFLELPDREVRYSQNGASFGLLKRALIQKSINKKQLNWTGQQVEKSEFDLIISDNVYGVHHASTPSILITHQLNPISPLLRSPISHEIAQWINKFDEIWIPDIGDDGLSGEMLQNPSVKITRRYLGNISRFKNERADKDLEYLGIISGPEPQAKIFCDMVVQKFQETHAHGMIVYNGKGTVINSRIGFAKEIGSNELNKLALRSKLIICRAGFTSLLDMFKIKACTLVVPTPGQPEQIYLAQRLKSAELIDSVNQKDFNEYKFDNLQRNHIPENWSESNLDQVLDQYLKALTPSVG